MIAVLGCFRLPPEQVPAARPLMQQVIAETLREPGCQAYAYAEDVSEPGLFRVAELWDSREALAAHFEAPHMRRWCEERLALGFHDRQIACHEIGPPQPL